MMKPIDPEKFDLPPRTVLRAAGKSGIAIVINRRSRIIMGDGKKILEKAMKIKKHQPGINIILETSAPVCSKTAAFLSENNIKVIQTVNHPGAFDR